MEKLTRRMFLTGTAAVSGGLALAACVPVVAPPPSESETGPAKVDSSAPGDNGQVVVTFNMRAGGEKSEPTMYVIRPNEFMEENPHIKVELAPIPGPPTYWAKMQTMAAAGTIGDVIWSNDITGEHSRLTRLGIMAAVDEHLDSHDISKDEWLPAAVESLSYEGKLHGMFKVSQPGVAFMFLNVTLFEEAGVDVPAKDAMLEPDELLEMARALAKGPEDSREVFGCKPRHDIIHSLVNGGRMFGSYENNKEGTESLYDAPEWLEWAKWNNSFYVESLAPRDEQIDSGGTRGLFASNKLAIMNEGRWGWNQINRAVRAADNPPEWSWIESPKLPSHKGWNSTIAGHSPTTNSKDPVAAFEFAYALADRRMAELNLGQLGYLTARVDDIDQIREGKFENTDWLEIQYQAQVAQEPFHQPANLRGGEVHTILRNTLDLIWLGEEEPTEDFMKALKAKVDEILAKPF